MKTCFKISFLTLVLAAFAAPAVAQDARSLLLSGDKALYSYNFAAARDDYARALERTSDPVERAAIEEKLTWCENGINMLNYASRPRVLSSHTVPRDDFFLYYGHFPDRTWRQGSGYAPFPYSDNMDKVVIPVKGDSGSYDLSFASRTQDGWSPLTDMGSGVNSPEDELYPVLSEDGKTVWFSSKGLYGMGGYDIFVSQWDEQRQEWGVAENLGFPFSSPYDDLLFCNTPDGKYSLFASNRACASDSIVIYLLQFDPQPVKQAVGSVEAARMLASLRPRPSLAIDPGQFSHTMHSDDYFSRYFNLAGQYSAVQDSIKKIGLTLKGLRSRATGYDEDDPERAQIGREIMALEAEQQALQSRRDKVIAPKLKEVEMEFQSRGETIVQGELRQDEIESSINAAQDVSGETQYNFVRRTAGAVPDFDFAQPEKEADDMAFRVEDETVLIHGYELPEGLLYQIQVLTSTSPLPDSRLKGLNPAFEKKFTKSYVYRVGWFETWAEANQALSVVKKKGFNNANIVAFDKKTNVTIKEAKNIEAKRKDNVKYRLVFRDYPDGLPAEVLKAVREGSPVDIARGTEDGRTIYFVAPLDKAAAGRLRDAAEAAGAEKVSVEPIKQ